MNTYKVKLNQCYSYHYTVEAKNEEEAKVSAKWRLFFGEGAMARRCGITDGVSR